MAAHKPPGFIRNFPTLEFVLFDHKIRNKIKMFNKIRNINTTFIIVQTYIKIRTGVTGGNSFDILTILKNKPIFIHKH